MVIVVMGVTGAGKTTAGTLLATTLAWPFVEGDSLHPPANVDKMRAGIPLTETDRAPWLAAIHAVIAGAVERRESLVVACSALKERYRDLLRGDCRGVRFVYLRVIPSVAVERTATRTGHFAGPALVPSQFQALEEPGDAMIVDGTMPPEQIVADVRRELGM